VRTYDPDVRLLACERCGAPLPEVEGAVSLRCGFCDAQHQLSLPTVVPTGEPVDASTREQRLLAQLDRAVSASPIADLLDRGSLAPWREKEAVVAWVAIREALRQGHDDAEAKRFYALTLALAEAAWADPIKQRAWLESGYEVAQLPRHRTVFSARLARGAAEGEELAAAETWLSRGDEASQDLEAFSSASIARALIARGRGHVEAQREAIVETQGRLLLVGDDLPLGALLRADAQARSGELEAGIATLDRAADLGGPKLRAEVHRLCEARPDLAAEAYRAFCERRGKARYSITYNAVVLAFFTLAWGAFGVFAIARLVSGRGLGWAAGGVLGLAASVFLASMLSMLWMMRDGWRKPMWATVVDTTPSAGAGEHRTRATLRVALQSEEEPVTVLGEDGDALSPGDPVLVFPSGQGLDGYVLLR